MRERTDCVLRSEKSQIMLENKIIQLDKVKTFVQHYKILHISFSAEGCFIGEPLIISSIMGLKEPMWWIEKNYFEALFPSFTSETAWIYDLCTGILIWFPQFYLKNYQSMKFLKRLCSSCRKIKYVTGSRFLCIQRSALFLFSLKTAVSNFGKKRLIVSHDSVPLEELNLSERKEVRV